MSVDLQTALAADGHPAAGHREATYVPSSYVVAAAKSYRPMVSLMFQPHLYVSLNCTEQRPVLVFNRLTLQLTAKQQVYVKRTRKNIIGVRVDGTTNCGH
jgi:hypothetical protein